MRSLIAVVVWIIMASLVLTGFWHLWLYYALPVLVLIIFIAVKTLVTWKRLACRTVWRWLVGLRLIVVPAVWPPVVPLTIQEGDAVSVQLIQSLKPDTMTARLVDDSGVVGESYFLLQSSKQFPSPWSILLLTRDQWSAAADVQWHSGPSRPTWNAWAFEYDRRMTMRGFDGHLRTDAWIMLPPSMSASPQLPRSAKLHHRLSLTLWSIYTSRTSGLLQGMIVWGRSQMSQDEYGDFIDSWLVHLIAVSGSNILMIVLFLGLVLFWVPYYLRIWTTLLVVVGYSVLCGLDSSVFRALVMGCTMLCALMVGRRVSVWRAMLYALCILIVTNPWMLLYDLGFHLSFAALIGIVVVDRWRRIWGRKSPILTYLLPSFGAAFGVFPVLLLSLWVINLLSPFVNLIVVPFVPILLLGWLLGVSWLPWVATGVSMLVDRLFVIAGWATEHGRYLQVDDTVTKAVVVLCLSSLIWVIVIITYYYKRKNIIRA